MAAEMNCFEERKSLNLFNIPMNRSFIPAVFLLGFVAALPGFSQATPKPDVMVLVDGEKLIGHLESADSDQVVFKSDIAAR